MYRIKAHASWCAFFITFFQRILEMYKIYPHWKFSKQSLVESSYGNGLKVKYVQFTESIYQE